MEIHNYTTFLQFLKKYADDKPARIFRGVESDKFELIPSIGRLKHKSGKGINEKHEDVIFRFFKQRSKPFLTRDYDEMNLLAIAQHHGLPTRLLDWTFNPLAAIYFAVEKELPKNSGASHSVIHVYDKPIKVTVNETFSSIKVKKPTFFLPNYYDDRIVNQNGLFTVHPYPWKPLQDRNIIAVPIRLNFRRPLRIILNRLGVNQGTIYPGLDGIAGHIKWMETNFY
jgi:hypothetical protein